MTNRDTQDVLMGKLLDIEQVGDENHELVMKSIEALTDIIEALHKRVIALEAKVNER
jgi:hypothetical protein